VDTPLLLLAKLDVAATAPNQGFDFTSADSGHHSDLNGYQSKTRSQPKFCRFLTSRHFTSCLWNGHEEWFSSHKSRLTSKRLYSEAFAQRSKILPFDCHSFSFGTTLLPTIAGMLPSSSLQSFAGRSGPQSPSPPGDGSVVSGKSRGLAAVLLPVWYYGMELLGVVRADSGTL
jgi:hypothetical protein